MLLPPNYNFLIKSECPQSRTALLRSGQHYAGKGSWEGKPANGFHPRHYKGEDF